MKSIDEIINDIVKNNLTNKYILKIKDDYNVVLKSSQSDCLLYLFPLIERVILEILSLIPSSDIEKYEQGTYRTLPSILAKNKPKLMEIIGEENMKTLEYYFDDNEDFMCLRNLVCHTSILKEIKLYDIELLKHLSMNLITLLDSIYLQASDKINYEIRLLK